jgi:hypothetical protein
VSNKQLELMGRYMAELGMTPASRSRVTTRGGSPESLPVLFKVIYGREGEPGRDALGNLIEHDPHVRTVPAGIM